MDPATVFHAVMMWGFVLPLYLVGLVWLALITPVAADAVAIGYQPSKSIIRRVMMEGVVLPTFALVFVVVFTLICFAALMAATSGR